MAPLLLLHAPVLDRLSALYKGHEAWIGITLTLIALFFLGLYGLKRLPHVLRAKRHPTLTPLQLEEMLQGPAPLLVDLRDEGHFKREGHIRGVMHVPFPTLERRIKEVLKAAREPRVRAIVLIDEHDPQAHRAADVLAAYGVDWLYVLMDGFHGWRRAGYKVTK
jgi:rhodanese-related sulfurtransferase